MNSKQVACGLGWFGIGLGLVELFAPNAVGRAVGLEGRAGFIRLFGLREIASGVVILTAEEPDARLWIRVLGDGLDGALLASGLGKNNPLRQRTLMGTLAVAPIVVLDILYAMKSGDGESSR